MARGHFPQDVVSTCIVIEHSEAVGVVVPKELPRYDTVVLLDHLQVLLVEALSEPGLVLGLLKEPWGHVANNVDLQGRGTGIRDVLSVSTLNPPMSSRAGGPPSEWNPRGPLPQTLTHPLTGALVSKLGLSLPGCVRTLHGRMHLCLMIPKSPGHWITSTEM